MARKVIKYKNRAEWLEGRGKGIGASEAGTVLGLNPFCTPYQLWRRKKGLDAPEPENFAMRAGHYLEDAVSLFFRDESGAQIIKASTEDFTILDTERPWLRVSPDRTFWRPEATHNEQNKAILECKTTQLQIDADNLPKHWFCQIQMNMGVSDYHDGALAWLTQGREFAYRDIEFDREFWDWMAEQLTEYWQRYIVGDEEPPMYTAEDIMIKYPRHTEGKTVTADGDIMEQLERLKIIKEQQKPLADEQKEIEQNLKLFFADAETITDMQGNTLATWKAPKPSRKFDQKAWEAATPEDERAKWYTEVQGARRLLIK